MKSGCLCNAIRGTLAVTICSIGLTLLIDHLLPGWWALAILPFLWTILAVYLIAPACGILLLIPQYRRLAGCGALVGNILAAGVLGVVINYSDAVDALMSV